VHHAAEGDFASAKVYAFEMQVENNQTAALIASYFAEWKWEF
jgi:hypothetical protein